MWCDNDDDDETDLYLLVNACTNLMQINLCDGLFQWRCRHNNAARWLVSGNSSQLSLLKAACLNIVGCCVFG